jgi:glycine oxidase
MPVNATERGSADGHDRNTAVAIIGDGIIGLSIAYELGRIGVECRMFGSSEPGAASGAAAGLLAPHIGTLSEAVRPLFEASLAAYPAFIDDLRNYEPGLALIQGLVEASTDASQADAEPGARRLTREEVHQLEPELAAPWGALFHERDCAIDNVTLMRALRRAVADAPGVVVTTGDPIMEIDLGTETAVVTRSGIRFPCATVVLAAGAWSARIRGLPRPLPVTPLKGQMLALASSAVRHSVLSDHVYLVPRFGEIVVGATVEHAGFDLTVDSDAIEGLRRAAVGACPALADAPLVRSWAGIRPATPDMLPILGVEPRDPRLVYAGGHSKNGILLAPATATAIAAIVSGRTPPIDLTPFAIGRFGDA